MISFNNLIGMIYSEACGGGFPDHYFDETKNPNKEYPIIKEKYNKPKQDIPPIKYTLELIRKEDDSLEWVE